MFQRRSGLWPKLRCSSCGSVWSDAAGQVSMCLSDQVEISINKKGNFGVAT
jgi:uncharacterized Zn finger protein